MRAFVNDNSVNIISLEDGKNWYLLCKKTHLKTLNMSSNSVFTGITLEFQTLTENIKRFTSTKDFLNSIDKNYDRDILLKMLYKKINEEVI